MRVSEDIKITEDMVIQFSELSGDKNPIHLDDEYAKNSVFGKKIVHGILLVSFFSKLIADKYPGEGSIYLSQNVHFKNPCFINDTITVIVELNEKIKNKYYLKTSIVRDNITLIEGDAVILKKEQNETH
jgi:3-hydroxybutyryl-CoA dehydratase